MQQTYWMTAGRVYDNTQDKWWAVGHRRGQDTSFDVSKAIGMCILIFFTNYITLLLLGKDNTTNTLENHRTSLWQYTGWVMSSGAQDTSNNMSWAIGMCFFYISFDFFTNYITLQRLDKDDSTHDNRHTEQLQDKLTTIHTMCDK